MGGIPYFDAHCDTIYELTRLESPTACLRDFSGHISLEKLGIYRPAAQFFALFEGAEDGGFFSFDELYQVFRRELLQNEDRMLFCRSAADLARAEQEGKLAAFLSVEGCGLLGCDAKRLADAYDAGVRALMLTWNRANRLSGSNIEEPERGLSAAGRAFAAEAMELGMLLDVSHLSDRGFFDLAELAGEKGVPLMASHSNSRALCAHPRNLTDEMFSAVIKTGGFVGVNLYTAFLRREGEATLDDVLRHVEHFLALGGEKNVGLGCDFDGCESLPREIGGAADMGALYERMLRAGYSETLAGDIFYGNMRSLIERAL